MGTRSTPKTGEMGSISIGATELDPLPAKAGTSEAKSRVIEPGDPPAKLPPSANVGADRAANELGGKRGVEGPTPHEAVEMAQRDYDAKRAALYTAQINYQGGPDVVATADYLRLLTRPWHNRRVLDVGTGEGKLPNEWPPLARARLIVGLDISKPFLQQAQRERADNASYILASMNQTAIQSESMDSVISRFALHYSPDLGALFKELARVLKPGGDLTFITNMIHGKNGAPVSEAVTHGWIPIRLSETLTVNNLALTDRAYFDALAAAGFEVEIERRYPANHKIAPEYAHRDEIDLEAVVVRARKAR